MNKWHANNVLNKVRKDINCLVEDILLYKDYSKTYDSINCAINKLIKLKEYMEENDLYSARINKNNEKANN